MAVLEIAVEQALGVGVQKLHREMDALEIPPLRFGEEVVRLRGTAAEDHGVEVALELLGRVGLADFAVDDELDPLGGQQVHAALDNGLVELHVGDAVHQQSANAVGPLEDGDAVARLVELGGARQPRGAGADHSDLLAACVWSAVAA